MKHQGILTSTLLATWEPGKSSGLNSLFSAVDSRLVRRTMVRAAADESITLDFNLRPLTQNIRIGDSWGWDNNNYNLREFEYILKGQLPLKFEEGGPLDANLLNTLPKNSLTADNRIHCVIFYYPAPSIGNAETVKRFDYFRKIAEKASSILLPFLYYFYLLLLL